MSPRSPAILLGALVLALALAPLAARPAAAKEKPPRLDLYVEGAPHRLSLEGRSGEERVSLEALAPILGLSLRYDESRMNVVIDRGGKKAILSVREALATVGERVYRLDPPPRLDDERILVPLGFIQPVLGSLYPGGAVRLPGERVVVFGKGGPFRLEVLVEPGEELSAVRLVCRGRPHYQVHSDPKGVWVLFDPDSPAETTFRDKAVRDGVIEKVRYGRGPGGRRGVRVTFDDEYHLHRVREIEERGEILIELFRRRPAGAAGAAGEAPAPPVAQEGQAPPVAPGRQPGESLLSAPRLLRAVAIDPGHGGGETGATGPSGLMEKEVVLDVANRLGRLLRERAGLEVYLTREGDVGLPLEARIAVANHNQADLFISLHVNASTSPRARGSETYYLSTEATDSEARTLAEAENRGFQGSFGAAAGEDDQLRLILWDMAQTEFLQESSRLAERIQTELNTLLSTPSRGVKQAPFQVLVGASMPAVLVEMAFISNPEEEQLLRSDDFRERIATALYQSILSFQRDYEAMYRGGAAGSAWP